MIRFFAFVIVVLVLPCAIYAEGRKPNVLLILTDDQGTLDVNCYGSKDLYTPNLDRLAGEGVRFTQAYAHAVCCPARAMLLTGRHPQRSNVNNWTQGDLKASRGLNMTLSEVTLAEVLRDAGYRTALFGKWHLGAAADSGPTKQGFDEFFGHRGGFIDNYSHHFLHGRGFHDLYRGTEEQFRRDVYFPDMIVDEATRFIDKHKDSPFFLYLALNIPHYPEQADAKFDERFADLEEPRRSYAKMIATTDDRIGRILKKLDGLELTDDTIIFFMSDNGHSTEQFKIRVDNHTSGLPKGHNYGANGGGGNAGTWRGHKGTFYEGGIRVPAIIRYPKSLPTGIVRHQAVTACDVMPTILDLCSITHPQNIKFDGETMLPIINDNALTHHKVMHWQWRNNWAVREGDWKLLGSGDGKKQFELVNLADDQPERKNHAAEQPQIVERLRELHLEWYEDVLKK